MALYKTATASSIESVNYPASKAVDDDISTKWSSSSSNYKQSLTVDLGQKYSINKVQIIWADTYFSNVYDIQLSDDNTNWSTIKTVTNSNARSSDTIQDLSGSGRYIRFNGRGRGTGGTDGSRYRISEFKIYGHLSDTATPEQKIQIDTITNRLISKYVPGSVSIVNIDTLLNNQQSDGSWSDIDYTSVTADFPATLHLTRLQQLAVAYCTQGTIYYDSSYVKDRILLGLGYYMTKNPQSTNWWYNDIGGPQNYMIPLILLKSHVPIDTLIKYSAYLRDQIPRFEGDAKNLSWIATIAMYKACAENNYAMVEESFKAIYSTLQIVTGQDDEGIKIDNSFHQHHAQLYSGGYGMSLLSDIANTIQLAEGTDFINSISATNRQILADYILKGTQLLGYRSMIDFGTTGRNISRQTTSNYNNISTSFLKKMIDLDSVNAQAYNNLINHLSGGIFPQAYQGNKYFWKSDIMTQHGANYYLSAKVISNRTYGTESLNNENIKGYNLPIGATNISTDGTEYNLIYPVWDWARIPGTTAVQNQDSTALDGYQIGTNSFAGGVSNGQNGLIAFDATYRQVHAKKSYFFMNNAMVCLGAEISANQNNAVYTSINQSFLSGDVYYSNNNSAQLFEDSMHAFSNLQWVHQRNVGYIFPANENITIQKGVQKGTWNSININGSADTIRKNVFSIWADHGSNPANANYEYIVVPDKSLSDFQSYAVNNKFVIVRNDSAIQAVRNDSVKQYGIVFYQPGTIDMGDGLNISSDKSALVFISKNDSDYKISVSDPFYTASTIQIKIDKQLSGVNAVINNDSTIIQVALPTGDSTGSTVTNEYIDANDLPVTLDDLNLTNVDGIVRIDWNTVSETGIKSFQILHSVDNKHFQKIGQLLALGTPAATKSYLLFDYSPAQGNNYYQLRSISLNGDSTVETTKVIKLSNKDKQLLLFPNPVHSDLTIQHETNCFEVEIMTIAGKIIMKKNISEEESQTNLNVSSLPLGSYIIIVSGREKKAIGKFIKM
ncbi:MAG: polysaccharide lyase family 8 super-sandwich domain-containing protein [Arachidicoccus sp.]|nr:polysaccharide lyase family 8 super-sandwich domain-containing protein [Arachidicoccus sp.]